MTRSCTIRTTTSPPLAGPRARRRRRPVRRPRRCGRAATRCSTRARRASCRVAATAPRRPPRARARGRRTSGATKRATRTTMRVAVPHQRLAAYSWRSEALNSTPPRNVRRRVIPSAVSSAAVSSSTPGGVTARQRWVSGRGTSRVPAAPEQHLLGDGRDVVGPDEHVAERDSPAIPGSARPRTRAAATRRRAPGGGTRSRGRGWRCSTRRRPSARRRDGATTPRRWPCRRRGTRARTRAGRGRPRSGRGRAATPTPGPAGGRGGPAGRTSATTRRWRDLVGSGRAVGRDARSGCRARPPSTWNEAAMLRMAPGGLARRRRRG